MAVTTALSRNMRKVGTAIRDYATEQRINSFDGQDLAIAGVLDRNTERIYINVGVRPPINKLEWSAGIQQAIARVMGQVPSFDKLGIVVRQIDNVDAFYDQIPVHDDDLDLTDWLNYPG